MHLWIVALLIVLLHAPRDVFAQVVTFTNVVDSTTMSIVRGTSCLYPAINNAGQVALLAGSGTERGVYRWEAGELVPMILNDLGTNRSFDLIGGICYGPDVNDLGRVVALAFLPDGQEAILAGDGGSVLTVADTSGQFLSFSAGAYEVTPSLRNDGVTFFGVTFDVLRLPWAAAIYAGDGLTTWPVFDEANTGLSRFDPWPALTENGRVALWAGGTLPSGEGFGGLLAGTTAGLSLLFDHYSSTWCGLAIRFGIDQSGRAPFAYTPFSGEGCGQYHLFLLSTSGSQTVATTAGAFYATSISEHGLLAFGDSAFGDSIHYSGESGNFKVVETGDSLFGSTVSRIDFGRHAVNDFGQIAFKYRLADGREGYALASVPEPNSAASLGAAVMSLIGLSRGWSQRPGLRR